MIQLTKKGLIFGMSIQMIIIILTLVVMFGLYLVLKKNLFGSLLGL